MKLPALGNKVGANLKQSQGLPISGSFMRTNWATVTSLVAANAVSLLFGPLSIAAPGLGNSAPAHGKTSYSDKEMQILIFTEMDRSAMGEASKKNRCSSCVPYSIERKQGVIVANREASKDLGVGSVFQDGKLLLAVSKPNYKVSIKPDAKKNGIKATVKFPANSVAMLQQDEKGVFRAANFMGAPINISIFASNGKEYPISLSAGEELCLAPSIINEEYLIPSDGVDREAVCCSTIFPGIKGIKANFDIAEAAKSEPLFACESNFVKGAGLLNYAKREILSSSKPLHSYSPIAKAH